MNKKLRTKDICITAMGIALFVVLSMCLRVPIFENYYVCLGYVVMTVWVYNMGTASGTIVGCVGTLLYCILINGLRGMPGWVLGNVFIGLMVGHIIKKLKDSDTNVFNFIVITIVSCVATFIGIIVVKSFVECVLYSQPMLVRMITNVPAFISDCVTIILSIPLAMKLSKPLNKIIE